jgi:hypothetical protein
MSNCCHAQKGKPFNCPECGHSGQLLGSITPKHTLKQQYRDEIDDSLSYYFCDRANCKVVYFSQSAQLFTVDSLINLVTQKSASNETPLCYCYKITKGDVLQQIADYGQTDVLDHIKQQMEQIPCFCHKSNPQGVCCLQSVQQWLIQNKLSYFAS